MKKLLLLLAGCLFAGGAAFAQNEAETETPAETPGWKITANCLEPSGIEPVVYNMEASGVMKTGATSEVYYADVALPVFPNHSNPKPSKYQYVITYTAEDGSQKTQTQQLTQQIADGDINVKISAWLDAGGNIISYTSVANYILADSNWTGLVYLSSSTTGNANTFYFNARANNVVSAMRGLNAGSSTSQFLAGNGTQYQNVFISDLKENQGICSATIDYSNSTVVIKNVSDIVLSISDYQSFVAPADVTLPSGVTAYVYDKLEDGVLYLKNLGSNVVTYNTPVILKAATPGDYTLTITGACQYDPQSVSSRTILLDVNEENSILYGVLQAHFLPTDAYSFNGKEFVKVVNAQSVINPFTCYILPADATDVPESISIALPDNTEVPATAVEIGSVTLNEPSFTSQTGNVTEVTRGESVGVTVVPVPANSTDVIKVTADNGATVTMNDDLTWNVDTDGVDVKTGETVTVTITATAGEGVEATQTISVKGLLLGDANANGKVTIADVVTIANYIVEIPVYSFCWPNADVILSDNEDEEGRDAIDIRDITATVNIVLGVFDPSRNREMSRTRRNSRNILTGDRLVANKVSDNKIAVSLENTYAYSALQAEIAIPEGMKVNSVTAGERAAGFEVVYDVNAEGKLIVVLYSNTNAAIGDGDGSIFDINVTGDGNMENCEMINIHASDARSNGYDLEGYVNACGAAGIEGLDADDVNVIYYTVEGVQVKNPEKGQILIRVANGEATKVMVK